MTVQIDKNLIDHDVEPTEDKIHRTIKVSLSAIPVFGGAFAEVFNSIIKPPIEDRQNRWMLEVTEALNQLLTENRCSISDLQNNEKFITTLFNASASAIRNHSHEKRVMLKNAVINSAVNVEMSDWKQTIFLNMIERYSTLHLLMLKEANIKRNWIMDAFKMKRARNNGFRAILLETYPDLKDNIDFCYIIWDELYRENLVTENRFDGFSEKRSMSFVLTTPFAQEFLEFISS